jgi:molybdopterin-containing oxidoreductase family iron-sulfur binding subunit
LSGEQPNLEQLTSEFPMLAEAIARHDRRSFLRILGASMALAGITSTGCRRWPVEELRPHTSAMAGMSPGVADHYATLVEFGACSQSALAKSYDGRPIKIEGNPDHPASQGAASCWAQASVLDLYDPDRSRGIIYRGNIGSEQTTAMEADGVGGPSEQDRLLAHQFWKPSSPRVAWEQFAAATRGVFAGHQARQGEGLAVLVHPSSSPTQQRWITELKQKSPKIRWFAYEAIDRDSEWLGVKAAFGQILRPQYDLTKSKFILCIQADPLGLHPNHLQHARDWATGRDSVQRGTMNRLVSIESSWTLTGAIADTRVALKPSQCEQALLHIAQRLGIGSIGPESPESAAVSTHLPELEAIASELRQFGPDAVVIGGSGVSQEAHQLICVLNANLGALGNSLAYTTEPLADLASQGYWGSINQLSKLLEGNVIQTLVILGGNPSYDAPADAQLDLSSSSQRPLLTIHLSSHDNETSRACTWHIPLAHALEAWSDGRSWNGTYTLGQPLIEPLFAGKTSLDVLALIGGQEKIDGRAEVRRTFSNLFPDDGNRGWEQSLHDGFRAASAFSSVPAATPKPPTGSVASMEVDTTSSGFPFEVQFIPDGSVYDGRFANNAWLQELPDPISKLTWDNAAAISPIDAQRLNVQQGQFIRLNESVALPAMIMPGQAEGCLSLTLGFGRSHAGRVGNGVGVNVYPLRKSGVQTHGHLVLTAQATPEHTELASTQMHHILPSIADVALRARLGEKGQAGLLIHEALLTEYLEDPHAVHGDAHTPHAAPLFDLPDSLGTPHRWAMTIDLNKCIGCSGCVVACQAENNIPVVGKENVLVNREMHWLRIDRYFKGPADAPDMVHVPVACAHCENAPCEQVCPVAATLHDAEGTNTMVYNRCIGTRYCANNCPYKVRRFNYFDYQASDPREPAKPWVGIPDEQQASDVSTLKKMVHNPEVTVRMRGVMEKCTFCIQRIASARITAKNEFAAGSRDSDLVRDGELVTACQATCPTRAIEFGDLNDSHSRVSASRRSDRNYEMLAELNLGARTTYLAKIRNRPS